MSFLEPPSSRSESLLESGRSGNSQPNLGLLRLTALAIVSVDSIRNLPINAQEGLPVVTFYIIGGLTFFLPLTMATRELAVLFPKTGGSYLWVQSAFGSHIAFINMWLLWISNMIWYPTIFTFLSSTLASMINPNLQTNEVFMLVGGLGFFWAMTAVSARGIEAQTWLTVVLTIFGTILPMTFIIILAAVWLIRGNESQTPLSFQGLLPNSNTWSNLAYFVNILFSLLGIEVVATHAKDIKDPSKMYPRALLISSIVIISTLTLASLSVCIVVAPSKLSLITGLMDAFHAFFGAYGIPWAAYCIGVSIILGGLGVTSSWIIGVSRSLRVACVDASMPKWLTVVNKHQMPYMIMILQGILFTLLTLTYILFPNVNNYYWLLSTMTAQLNLTYYIVLFLAVAKIKKQRGLFNWKSAISPTVAIVSCLTGIIVGYFPPSNIAKDFYVQFELILIGGELVLCLPLVYLYFRRPRGSRVSDI